jgi:hypothetical protein
MAHPDQAEPNLLLIFKLIQMAVCWLEYFLFDMVAARALSEWRCSVIGVSIFPSRVPSVVSVAASKTKSDPGRNKGFLP